MVLNVRYIAQNRAIRREIESTNRSSARVAGIIRSVAKIPGA
jgi:hypothetical protein